MTSSDAGGLSFSTGFLSSFSHPHPVGPYWVRRFSQLLSAEALGRQATETCSDQAIDWVGLKIGTWNTSSVTRQGFAGNTMCTPITNPRVDIHQMIGERRASL